MKQLINDIRNDWDAFWREMAYAVVGLTMFAVIMLATFAVWGNV